MQDAAPGKRRPGGGRRGAREAARARCRCGGLAACAPGPGGSDAPPSLGEVAGEGRGRRRRVGRGEERPVGGGRGRRAAGRRAEGAGRAPSAGPGPRRPGALEGADVCLAPTVPGLRLRAPEARAAASSPGGRRSARLSPGSGRAAGAAPPQAGTQLSRRSRRACLGDRRWGRGLSRADPQTAPFFLLCNLRSPQLWLGRHDRPTVPGGQGAWG